VLGPAPDIRASDKDRERVVDVLGQHCAGGRLSVKDLDERTSAALSAQTRGELDALLVDLPELAPAELGTPTPNGPRISAVMGGAERRGRWQPAAYTRARAVMGGCRLDLREAAIEGREVTIDAVAFMGGIEIVVSEETYVELEGYAFMGRKAASVSGIPVSRAHARVHVRARATMGSVVVKSAPPDAVRAPR
jgi:DUF1707 SHOCT-like domain